MLVLQDINDIIRRLLTGVNRAALGGTIPQPAPGAFIDELVDAAMRYIVSLFSLTLSLSPPFSNCFLRPLGPSLWTKTKMSSN